MSDEMMDITQELDTILSPFIRRDMMVDFGYVPVRIRQKMGHNSKP